MGIASARLKRVPRNDIQNKWPGRCGPQQAASRFPTLPLITALAQPTPELTEMASKGQFMAHAPHSIHRSMLTMRALLSSMDKTLWGQTSTQMPQPVHFSWSNLKVATPLRYVILMLLLSGPLLSYYAPDEYDHPQHGRSHNSWQSHPYLSLHP